MSQKVVSVRSRAAVSTAAIEALEDRRLFSAGISVQQVNGLPGASQVAFNRIQIPNPDVGDIVHDTNTIKITNTGDSALVISSLSLSDTTNWQLVNPPANGTTVAAGGSVNVTIKFVAQSVPPNQPVDETNDTVSTDGLPPSQTGGVWNATLTINSNATNNSADPVTLAGYWQYESEHEEEPNLMTIVNRLYGYGTAIADDPQPDYLNNGMSVVRYGQEVLSPYWQAADASQPITVYQIAAFHNEQDQSNGQTPAAQIGWFAENSSPADATVFLRHAVDNSESLQPNLYGTTSTPAVATFSPGNTAFGLNIDGESSVDSQNTTDINTYGRTGHTDRFYPARDANGNLIPNTWILAMDYENGSYDNSDYQDNVYLITNVRPTVQAPAPSNLQATTSAGSVTLTWTGGTDSTLQGYNVYRSNSATGTFTKLNSSPISGTKFVDSSPGSSTEYYQVSAVDSAGESEKSAVSTTPSSSGGGVGSGDGGGTADGADLTVTTVTGKFSNTIIGNTMSGPTRVTVTNGGNQTARGTIQVAEFLSSTPDSISSGATEVSHKNVAINLKSGKSVNVAMPGFRYASSLSGQYYLVAQVTDVKGITESNTSNNTGASTALAIAAPYVDLQNLFTGALPSITPGKRVTIQVPVINNGNVAAHGMATITIGASPNSSGGENTTIATIKRAIVVGAGKTAKLNLSFVLPTTLAPGTYHLVTTVMLPSDTNTSNDTAVSTGTFTV